MNRPVQFSAEEHNNLDLEYEQTNNNFRTLSEIRFKLLSFLPTLGGVAIFALSFLGLAPDNTTFIPTINHLWIVAGVSILGFIATLGIVFYDQRNSELYNALIHRAKYLESLFRSYNSPGSRRKGAFGGQFLERPRRGKPLFMLFKMGHDSGLALIYGSVLGAWFFPASLAFFRLISINEKAGLQAASAIALFCAILFILQLIWLDKIDGKKWNEAGKQKIFVLIEPTKTGYLARSPQFPEIIGEGKTAKEAEHKIRNALVQERINIEEHKKEIPESTIYGIYI